MKTARTIRRLPPETKKLTKYLNDLERTIKRINKLMPVLVDIEKETIAWQTRQTNYREKGQIDPLTLEPMDRSILQKTTEDLF